MTDEALFNDNLSTQRALVQFSFFLTLNHEKLNKQRY